MRTLLGSFALATSVSLLAFLLGSEMQYWTRLEFHTQKADATYAADAPHWDIGSYTGHVPTILTWIAVISAFAAVLLLIGRWRLVILLGSWLFMGLVNTGHFYAPGEATWVAIVVSATVAIIAPIFSPRLEEILANRPKGEYGAAVW